MIIGLLKLFLLFALYRLIRFYFRLKLSPRPNNDYVAKEERPLKSSEVGADTIEAEYRVIKD